MIDSARVLHDEEGTTIPLLTGLALLACAIALVGFDLSSIYAFRQALQFEADQFALIAATEQTSDTVAILARSASPAIVLDDIRVSLNSGQATVEVCSTWHATLHVELAPSARLVCVTADAR